MKPKLQRSHLRWTFALALALTSPGYAVEILVPGQVRVVNMVHKDQSGETRRDSEPNLTVDASDPLLMAATAFTPGPEGGNAPIYTSTDGGLNWRLNYTIPFNDKFTGTGDITLRFGSKSRVLADGTKRSVLYVAALEKQFDSSGDPDYRLRILRAKNFTSSDAMEILVSGNQVDQPYVQAISAVTGTGVYDDYAYVGYNALNLGTNPRSATVQWSNVAATAAAPAGFGAFVRIDFRVPPPAPALDPDPICGNGPVRVAVHSDGTVYAAFFRHKSGCNSGMHTSDIVVVRDDHRGARTNGYPAANAFQDLKDPVDIKPGAKVAGSIPIPYTFPPGDLAAGPRLGKQRIGDQVTIAVDPTNSQRVYVAWGQQMADGSYGIQVSSSENRGETWTARWSITSATNPSLAINSLGMVGILYQQLVSDPACSATDNCWVTKFERSSNDFASTSTLVLHKGADDVDWDVIKRNDKAGPLGEYIHLLAIDAVFNGVFSGNNTPNPNNFPSGCTDNIPNTCAYKRNAVFSTDPAVRNLLANDGTPVERSVDPFFFSFNPPIDLVRHCAERPWQCSYFLQIAKGRVKLKCLVRGCTLADLLPRMCPIAFQCPRCPRGLCPDFYHLHLEGLKAAWRVGLLDSKGNSVPHRQFATRRGVVISVRRELVAGADGQIDNALLAFEMGMKGTVGAEYRIKTNLTYGNRHYAPK